MKGFMTFIREQGVVGLAVGLAIGSAAGETVKSIVSNLIDPIVGIVTGGVNLSDISFSILSRGNEVSFGIGAVLSSLISLFAVAFVIYFIVKKAGLDKLDVEDDE